MTDARRYLARLWLAWRTTGDREALADLRRVAPLYREAWRALAIDERSKRAACPGLE